MTLLVQITIVTMGFLLLGAVVISTIQKKISEAHALLWFIPCLIIIVGGIFPQITYFLSNLFHTSYSPAIIFALAIIALYVILFQCFKSLSILTMKNKELASIIAIQEQHLQSLTEDIALLQKEREREKE